MKKSICILLRIYGILLVAFALQKLLFMGYYHSIYGVFPALEWVKVLWHGLVMDASVAGYFTLIPGVMLAVAPWLGKRFLPTALRFYFGVVSVLLGLVYTGDLLLFEYWGFRLDSTPLFYLATPKEAFASVGMGELCAGVLAMIVEMILFYLLFHFSVVRYSRSRKEGKGVRPYWISLVMILLTGLLILPIRGGVSVSTMNVGKVYFSPEMKLNQAAVNPCFSLQDSMLDSDDFNHSYRFMPDAEAETLFARLVDAPAADSIPALFTVQRPNVILVILEGFMAPVVEPLGGKQGVTPHLNEWCGQGVLFANLYGNSFRTDRGLVSILSGYPAQPTTSIMKYPKKSQSLPSIPRSLVKAGYETRYYYGGDADFTNMRSFLVAQGITQIVSQDDFPLDYRTTDWGVPDARVFQRAGADLAASRKEPFFDVIQTSSSHEPFKVDVQRFADPYLNSVYYADSCLNVYMEELRRSPYWQNTVVLMVSDHYNRRFQMDAEYADGRERRIPALIVGGAVRQPLRVEACAGQIDLAATLLYQLGLPHAEFRFSKNIVNPASPHFAFFTYSDGAGMVTKDSVYMQENAISVPPPSKANGLNIPGGEAPSSPDPRLSPLYQVTRAYLQTLYGDLAGR